MLLIGMAGSGKSTLATKIASLLTESASAPGSQSFEPYCINLDPAAAHVAFDPAVDIRDTVDHKELMRQYGLGPNGGIITALNLFTSRFDQVLNFVDRYAATCAEEMDARATDSADRAGASGAANDIASDSIPDDDSSSAAKADRGSPQRPLVLVDTPGQIEAFTWSASGQIITEAFAATYPTVVVYVVDTARSTSPTTFMSNMLYAVSILYKMRLPFVVAFNKTDVADHAFALEWMTDFRSFDEALEADTTFMSSLTRSMSLVLEEFYSTMTCVGTSARTGMGVADLLDAVGVASEQYWTEYRADLDDRRAAKSQLEAQARLEQVRRMQQDMQGLGGSGGGLANAAQGLSLND